MVVSTNRANSYLIEELESAAMEQGTVVLTLDAVRDEISTEGKIAPYGIRFVTGSSSIEAESAGTLGTIVQYLSENPERYFYVVGHTDDAGSPRQTDCSRRRSVVSGRQPRMGPKTVGRSTVASNSFRHTTNAALQKKGRACARPSGGTASLRISLHLSGCSCLCAVSIRC